MKDLIQIHEHQFHGTATRAVSARELHAFLKIPSRFNDWIVNRLKKYQFVENLDYILFTKNLVKGRPSKDYVLTIDTAKELAMVENNDQGRKIRQWFIECERQLRQVQAPTSQGDLILMLARQNVEKERRLSAVEQGLKLLEAKTNASDTNYFSVVGYASLHGHRVDIKIASTIGRKATKICNELGYIMGSIPDPRFGKVKTYPSEALETVFAETFLLTPQNTQL